MFQGFVSDDKGELSTHIHRSWLQRLLAWPVAFVLACYERFRCLQRRKEQLFRSHNLRYSWKVFQSLCLGCTAQLVCFKLGGPAYKIDWLMSLTVSAILLNILFWGWMQVDLYYQAGRSLPRK